MTAIYAALITAAITAVGAVIGYLLGYRRIRYEHLYEQRALVLAELSRLLARVQVTTMSSISPYQRQGTIRRQRLDEGRQVMTEAVHFFTASTLWLEPETSERVHRFLADISDLLASYESELNEQNQPSEAGLQAAQYIAELIPEARNDLEREFRGILYPPPWYETPLRLLEWLDAKLKRRNP